MSSCQIPIQEALDIPSALTLIFGWMVGLEFLFLVSLAQKTTTQEHPFTHSFMHKCAHSVVRGHQIGEEHSFIASKSINSLLFLFSESGAFICYQLRTFLIGSLHLYNWEATQTLSQGSQFCLHNLFILNKQFFVYPKVYYLILKQAIQNFSHKTI